VRTPNPAPQAQRRRRHAGLRADRARRQHVEHVVPPGHAQLAHVAHPRLLARGPHQQAFAAQERRIPRQVVFRGIRREERHPPGRQAGQLARRRVVVAQHGHVARLLVLHDPCLGRDVSRHVRVAVEVIGRC
jgi:hypothetical protein